MPSTTIRDSYEPRPYVLNKYFIALMAFLLIWHSSNLIGDKLPKVRPISYTHKLVWGGMCPQPSEIPTSHLCTKQIFYRFNRPRTETASHVAEHVSLDVAALREALGADSALEWFFVGVREDVLLQLVALREGLGADVAAVGSLTRVDQEVTLHRRPVREAPVAQVTLERLLARVDQHVSLHAAGLRVALGADSALE